MHFSINLADLIAIGVALGWLVADWLLGIALALKNHVFQLALLPRQLETLIAGTLAGLSFGSLLQAVTSGTPSVALVAFVVAAAAASSARSLKDIGGKIAAITGAVATTPPTPAPVVASSSIPTSAVPAPTTLTGGRG